MTGESKRTVIKTRIETEFANAVAAKAASKGMTTSEAIREALNLWLDDAHLDGEKGLNDLRKLLNDRSAMDAAWDVLKRGGN